MNTDVDQAFSSAYTLASQVVYAQRAVHGHRKVGFDLEQEFTKEFYQFLTSDLPVSQTFKLTALTTVVKKEIWDFRRDVSNMEVANASTLVKLAGLHLHKMAKVYQETTGFSLEGLDTISAAYPLPPDPPASPSSYRYATGVDDKIILDAFVQFDQEDGTKIDEITASMDHMANEMGRFFGQLDQSQPISSSKLKEARALKNNLKKVVKPSRSGRFSR